jgi:hypothetical protein
VIFWQKLIGEVKAVVLVMAYFACWLLFLLASKHLLLAEYQIEFSDMSKAIFGVLVLSKVVLVLEHVPLGVRVQSAPAWVDILLRTILYAFGVLIVLILERAFESRHEYGGFGAAFSGVIGNLNMAHVWVNTLAVTVSLLVYNSLRVIRINLGEERLLRVFLRPIPKDRSR